MFQIICQMYSFIFKKSREGKHFCMLFVLFYFLKSESNDISFHSKNNSEQSSCNFSVDFDKIWVL